VTYEPEPELTPEEQAAIASIKRRAARRQAQEELAQHLPQPYGVIVHHEDGSTAFHWRDGAGQAGVEPVPAD
jgi:hypothetical protein